MSPVDRSDAAPVPAGAAGPGGDWVRPRPAASALWRDAGLGLLMFVLAVVSVRLYQTVGLKTPRPLPWTVLIGIAGLALLPLCVRRRFPVTVMLICAAGFFVVGVTYQLIATTFVFQVALFMGVYAANAWAPSRRAATVGSVVVIVFMFAWIGVQVVVLERQHASTKEWVANLLLALGVNIPYFFGAVVFGRVAWRTARQRDELERNAVALRAGRDAQARQAVVDERLRIARELHDVVAHHVSSIGVQAAGARRVLSRDTDAAGQAMATIERSSREAVHEMRQLLGTLRASDDAPPDAAPRPGLPEIVELCHGSGAAGDGGPTVELTVVGEPRSVPSTLANSLYRITQESLTNVRRHSAAGRARVTLRWTNVAVEVEVVDDGPATDGDTAPARRAEQERSGSGLGLIGIRERAALHGGDVEIGPRVVGGWRVRARFRLPAASPSAVASGIEENVAGGNVGADHRADASTGTTGTTGSAAQPVGALTRDRDDRG